jgi:hypothetical protein
MPSTPVSPSDRRQRLLDDYVAIARRRKAGTLAATALRSRSLDARALLAHAVGGSATPLPAILAAAHDEDHAWLQSLGVEPEAPADLARVIAMQELLPNDLSDALAIYELVLAAYGPARIPPGHQGMHAQVAYRLGLRDRTRDLLGRYGRMPDAIRSGLQMDLVNPFAGGDGAATWSGLFGRLMPDDCVRLSHDDTLAPFDRLTTPAAALAPTVARMTRPSTAGGGPVVSVVVVARRPGPGADTALRSVIAQTWTDLEILLVQEGGDIAVPDPRIRLVPMPSTGDPRNAALDVAGGEFVAFQDIDTWSHPRRLERQLTPLLADLGLVATTSPAIEVADDLTVTRPGNTRQHRLSVSSLVFRRVPVLRRLGFLDTVNAAAGAEYLARIRTVYGDHAVHDVDDDAYALVRHNPARSDFRPGWAHPARTAYLDAYTAWHGEIRDGRAEPYLAREAGDRPFAAPARLTGIPARGYDVVLAGEWSAFGGPQKSMLEEISALTARGLRVAIMHLEAYRFMSRAPRPICAPIQRLVNADAVDRVLPGDEVDVSLLVIRYPPVLQFTSAAPSGIRAKRVVILANQAPSERDGSDVRYLPSTCSDNARRLFGGTGVWAPQGPAVRDFLAVDLPPGELAPYDIPGIIDAARWQDARSGLRGDRPVIGKHSRDNWTKWPADAATLLQAYPASDDIDVRLMGGDAGARALLGDRPLPANWRLYGYDEVEVRDFLRELDFFVYFPHPNMVEAFGRAILEAMSAGCVVLMPHHFRRTFGDAAVYCGPDEVEGLVRHLHRQPETFLQLSRHAQDVVRRDWSHDAYAALISTLID